MTEPSSSRRTRAAFVLAVGLVTALAGGCATPTDSATAPGSTSVASVDSAWRAPVPIDQVELARVASPSLVPIEIDELPAFHGAVHFARADGSMGTAYLSAENGEILASTKPLLVWCEGSGAQSVFRRWPQGLSGGLYSHLCERWSERFHVVVCEKRGVGFTEDREDPGTSGGASVEYHEHATWEGRVGQNVALLDALLAHPNVDASHVLVIGHSEGGDVAAGTAAMHDGVTHVATLAGAGGCQWAEMMMIVRDQARAEGEDEATAESWVASIESDLERLMADPDSTEAMLWGHAHRRWTSFGRHTPIDSLLATDAAIHMTQGTRDTAVPIESFDVVVVELLRFGKRPVVVRVPGADHGFRSPDGGDDDRILELLDDAVAWSLER